MRRLLAAAVLVAFMPAVHAQDKGKADFSLGAEFRLRNTYEQNEAGNKDTQPSHHNGTDQRFKLGLKFKANEKFSANATLLQSASWGQNTDDAAVGDRGTVSGGHEPNVMTVNEAYATWMMSEDLHAKFGRQNFSFGDGAVMSVNDFQMQPYSFDGVTVNYEAEFGRFTAFTFKYRDYQTTTGGASTLPATTSDPTHNAYGLVFDLKTMPEWLKTVSAHVIKDAGDAVWKTAADPSVNTTQSLDTLRYGVNGGFAFGAFDLKANYEMVSGKNRTAQSGGAVADTAKRDMSQNMYQAEVGFSMPNFMGSRFYASYHQDSGTSTADRTTGQKDNTYDGYFYEKHTGSGLMELVGWGNLTDTSVGWSMKPTDSTDVGLSYSMLSKTNSEDNVVGGTYGQNLFKTQSVGNTSSKIGDEIDLWAEHRYEGGLAMLARVGYFSPGDALKNDTANKKDNIMQFMVQGKLTF